MAIYHQIKRYFYIIFPTLLIITACNSEPETQEEKDYYVVINTVIDTILKSKYEIPRSKQVDYVLIRDSTYATLIFRRELDIEHCKSIFEKEAKSYFSFKNCETLQTQMKKSRDRKIDKKRITNSKIAIIQSLSQDPYNVHFSPLPDKKYSNYLYYFSTPVFSEDRKTAIIENVFYCGTLCATGYVDILQLVNGEWRVIKHIHTWDS
jgi:hypothetical protein